MPKPLDLRQRNREHDARRRTTQPWRKLYSTARWQALRTSQLRLEPLCKRCMDRGKVVQATVAHHKVAHRGNPELFFDPNNLASSCKPCHDIDEQRIERGGQARQIVGPDGWPLEI
ncbi:HNH endonuclease [Bradyrhizobium sp. 179]|nr:HNH endonuclease [Bradyrhizobium sp. 179]